MGQAKDRASEIAELKKNPRENEFVTKHRLKDVKTEAIFHFKNQAARAQANVPQDIDIRNSDQVTRHVKLGNIGEQFVQAVPLKIKMMTLHRAQKSSRKPMPFPIAVGAKDAELASYVAGMAEVAKGRGFRQPSTKAKNWQSTSLVEKLAIKWLGAEPLKFKRSERGERKAEAKRESDILVVLDQLAAQNPDQLKLAKRPGSNIEFFLEELEKRFGFDDPDLESKVRSRILHIGHPKYRHASARRAAILQQQMKLAA